MVIEIPEDFSERVTTVLEPTPKQLELRYIQNEGLNFMAAQVTKSATERIREQLANKITENYISQLVVMLDVLFNMGIIFGYLAVFFMLSFITFLVTFKSKSEQFDLPA